LSVLDEAGVTEVPAAEAEAPATPAALAELDAAGLDRLFRTARTRWRFRDETVSDDTLRRVYDLLKLGPTSANCSPARLLFLRTAEAKQRLRPALSAGNVDKTLAAPVVCIVAHDPRFYEDLPRLYPGVDARGWFAGNDELADETAFRNGTLQGAYLLLAARAVGLDCGPMSGFDNATVDREFLVAQGWKSNFLVALGYADGAPSGERAPRLTFDEACRLL
jgi:3-hydroxypropanoate dehydrogenase